MPKGKRNDNGGRNNGNRNNNNGNRNQNGAGHNQQQQVQHPNHQGLPSKPMKCVHPHACLQPDRLIFTMDINSGDIEVARVTCNNENCEVGNYMHLECFNDFEKSVLTFLGTTGRARSWNERQRLQNIWTKKGYDLVFKACACLCRNGHIRKDLNWISPAETRKLAPNRKNAARANNAAAGAGGAANNGNNANGGGGGGNNNQHQQVARAAQGGGAVQPEVAQQYGAAAGNAAGAGNKKKKGKAKEQLPSLALSAPIAHPNDNHNRKKELVTTTTTVDTGNNMWTPRGPFSPTLYNEDPASMAANRSRLNSTSSNGSACSATHSNSGNSCSPPSPAPIGLNKFPFQFQRKNSTGGDIPARSRSNSDGGFFAKRADMRVFNVLSRVKINQMNIKVDNHVGKNDDIRQYILPELRSHNIRKVPCVLCNDYMQVYDQCPLIDGTFFLSPRQHLPDSIIIPTNKEFNMYLNAACMHCCYKIKSAIFCRFCGTEWKGSDLVIGGCYKYDIFAASICCRGRCMCVNCEAPFTRPTAYSTATAVYFCDVCKLDDFHLARPVKHIYDIYSIRC